MRTTIYVHLHHFISSYILKNQSGNTKGSELICFTMHQRPYGGNFMWCRPYTQSCRWYRYMMVYVKIRFPNLDGSWKKWFAANALWATIPKLWGPPAHICTWGDRKVRVFHQRFKFCGLGMLNTEVKLFWSTVKLGWLMANNPRWNYIVNHWPGKSRWSTSAPPTPPISQYILSLDCKAR